MLPSTRTAGRGERRFAKVALRALRLEVSYRRLEVGYSYASQLTCMAIPDIQALELNLLRLPPEMLHRVLLYAFGTQQRPSFSNRSQSYHDPPRSLNIREALVLSSVSRASRALLRANPCFFASWQEYTCYSTTRRWTREGKPGPFSLLLGFRPRLTDGRLFWFLASLTVPVAVSGGVSSVIRVLDLRSTGITEQSIVTIFRTLPSLELLDVGECKDLNLIKMAGLLRGAGSRGLVVKQLKRMEVCGSGDGCYVIGYRQEVGWSETSYSDPRRSYEGPGGGGSGGFRQELKDKGVLHQVGGNTRLQGAVREIEAAVHNVQPRPVFTMGVNICEDCGVSFAEFVPHDGHEGECDDTEEKALEFMRSYGRHTCDICNRSAFLCLECASYQFHYCCKP
jgi:hypothetical protein